MIRNRTFSLCVFLCMTGSIIADDNPAKDDVVVKEKETTAAENPEKSLRKQLLGAWVLVGEPGTSAAPQPGARMKFFGESHWVITESDPTTGKTIWQHGGTYTLNGANYAETLTFANESTASMIGSEFRFTIEVDGDTYIQRGDGNPFDEQWQRLKAE